VMDTTEGEVCVHRDSNSYTNDWTCLHEGIRRVSTTCTRNFAWMCVSARTYMSERIVFASGVHASLILDTLKCGDRRISVIPTCRAIFEKIQRNHFSFFLSLLKKISLCTLNFVFLLIICSCIISDTRLIIEIET